MDTINVAILLNNKPITSLVFPSAVTDDELASFTEKLNGDSYQRLAFNQFVIDDSIQTLEKPSAEHTWSEEAQNWAPPVVEYPAPPADAFPEE